MINSLHVVLFAPEIPGNTGNIIRLCANTGASLHLIRPLGFSLDDARMKRAGLDYHEWADMRVHENWQVFMDSVSPARVFAMTTKGARNAFDARFEAGDALVFGPETRGLGEDFLTAVAPEYRLRLPMRAGRSLNLSNAVAVMVYEAWRQAGFAGATEGVNEAAGERLPG